MTIRPYNPDADFDAAFRVWMECGWVEKGKEQGVKDWLTAGRILVAEQDGDPECVVHAMPATLRYLDVDLPHSCVVGVTTSRVARKQGLAGRATAQLIAEEAESGALTSSLGIFEQGFYDRLGYGSSGYHIWAAFDPSHLKVKTPARPPKRLTKANFEEVHANRLRRKRGHGAISLLPAAFTRSEMEEDKEFGLGFRDADGTLTHHLWIQPEEVDSGPYNVKWMAWQTPEQFLELLGVLKSLEEQVRLVRVDEQPDIQLQDFIRQPLKAWQMSKGSKFETCIRAKSYYQYRINDLPGCLRLTHLPGETLSFNLELSDPVAGLLPESSRWRGVGGEWKVTLGQASVAERGASAGLPTLRTTVNAFTRLWLGVRPASGLAISDTLEGPEELLDRLDRLFRSVPPLQLDWNY